MKRTASMIQVLFLSACLLPGCFESNPQPSPGGGGGEENQQGKDTSDPLPGVDAAVPGDDVIGGGGDLPDTATDSVPPPEDGVTSDAMDILPELDVEDLTPDLLDIGDDCVPACGEKKCGDDGCGGSCGVCMNNCDPCGAMGGPYEDPELCMPDGTCAQVCCPMCCDGLECGDDGCAGTCGICGDEEVCIQNHCETPGDPCKDPPEYPDCNADLEEEACLEAGGTFGPGGLSPVPFCLCPTGDGGCPCDDGDTCVGLCWAPIDGDCQELTEGTCSDTVVMFGCFCVFEEEGVAWGLCID